MIKPLQILAFILGIITYSNAVFAKPIEIIVPYGPGSANDILARKLEAMLELDLVVINKPGASGNIAFQYFVDCKDICLMIAGPNIITNQKYFPDVYPKSVRNSKIVYLFGENLYVLIGNPKINSLQDLFSLSKTRDIKVGHGGVGSNSYYAYVELCKLIKCLEVPYKTSTSSIADISSGEIDVFTYDSRVIEQLVKTNKLNVLASLSDNEHTAIKTAKQLGYNIVIESWWALFARNMSDEQIKKIRKVLQNMNFDMDKLDYDPDTFWKEKING